MSISKEDLDEIRADLTLRRNKLLEMVKNQLKSDISLDRNEMADENDLASSEYLLSFELRIRDREKYLLRKIEDALERLDTGDFGVCESCGEDIAVPRLKARPVTTMCIRCKEEQERKEKEYVDN
ncbi:TraR/DksA C4-type zinc finger protein [Myxococcota bacterium]|nr:TraR/DksA C4-type zinc finger protein [Myxococcota bacterium]MBU1383174.1 TraR/DksA C4-type zinc finger protein [Myxococcota bacterium]MBU1497190.1 TraR/DksA C4-type zinc finger protein [Myxococcota bacterium]